MTDEAKRTEFNESITKHRDHGHRVTVTEFYDSGGVAGVPTVTLEIYPQRWPGSQVSAQITIPVEDDEIDNLIYLLHKAKEYLNAQAIIRDAIAKTKEV